MVFNHLSEFVRVRYHEKFMKINDQLAKMKLNITYTWVKTAGFKAIQQKNWLDWILLGDREVKV